MNRFTTGSRACRPTSTSTSGPRPFLAALRARAGRRRGSTAGRCTCPASGRTRSIRPTTTSDAARGRPRPTATSWSASPRRPRSGSTGCRAPRSSAGRGVARGRARAARRRSAPGRCPPRPDALDASARAAGRSGSSSAPTCSRRPAGSTALAPLLERARRRRGARCSSTPARPASPTRPAPAGWWAPVVPYVTQLHAAWWAWVDERPRALPAAAGLLRRARRARPAARRAPARPRRRARSGRPAHLRRDLELRHRRRSTPSSACSASTSSATARTGRTPSPPLPRLGSDAALHGLRIANPARLLANVPQEVTA